MDEIKNILPPNPLPDDKDLLRYMEGKLEGENLHEIEMQMAASSFIDDAMEGLQQFSNRGQIEIVASEINRSLRKRTTDRKKRRAKKKDENTNMLMLVIFLVLLIAILGYYFIKIYNQAQIK